MASTMWSQSCPFSIVLCTYNGERFLEEQLNSLRAQDGVLEIVVCDDGSTDQTLAILARHAAEDERIHVHRNVSRLGVTPNFQHAISLTRGPWIALADQDDVWLPGKLARMRACWDGDSCLMHHATRKFRTPTPPRLRSIRAGERRKFEGHDWRRLLYRNTVVGHTTLVSAKVVRQAMPFPEDLPHDWWIGVAAAFQGNVQFLDEYLVHYRIHATNAYHAAGSRYLRMREEYDLRIQMLAAIVGTTLPLRASDRAFAEEYRQLLRASNPGTFSWPLWRFYLRHASVFFSSPVFRISCYTRVRKSISATLAAFFRGPGVTRALGERIVA